MNEIAKANTGEIIITDTNGQLTVSSLQVARDFGKEHKHVLEAIENIKAENSAVTPMFIESTYKAGTGKNYKCYELTRDGFSLLVMGFTGKKALEWKLKYIEAFNKMEQAIRGQQKMLNAMLIQARADRAMAMRLNAENRRLKLLLDNPEWKNMNLSGISIETLGLKKYEELSGIDMGNSLPKVEEKTWTATEIGKAFGGISPQTIGKKSNALGLKTDEYGVTVLDKSRYSNKQVTTFRYNRKGVDALAEAFEISEYMLN